MSHLQKQQKAFNTQLASASSRYVKRTLPVGMSSSQRQNTEAANRIGPSSKQVFSQPEDTGKGTQMQTQIVYAVEHLKEKKKPLSFEDILSYLSKVNAENTFKDALKTILRRHDQVIWSHSENDLEGSYRFRPKHNISSATDLLTALQSQSTFKGIVVKELKEGWPDVESGITSLEGEHKVVVIRNKKDNTARSVWLDDPSLFVKVDQEFRDLWDKIRVPADPKQLVAEVEKEGQKPAGKERDSTLGPRTATKIDKKTKKPRRGGKTTNKHLTGMLKDYSHLRK